MKLDRVKFAKLNGILWTSGDGVWWQFQRMQIRHFPKADFEIQDHITNTTISNLEEYLESHEIDEIYYTLPLMNTNKIKDLIDYTERNMIRFKIVPDFRGFPLKRVNIDFYHDNPIISLRKEPLIDIMNRILKRLFDIVFS